MKIHVKSIPENWEKERDGCKPNTIRVLDGKDIIKITNTETGDIFERTITDITTWKGQIIISFKPKHDISMPESEINNILKVKKS